MKKMVRIISILVIIIVGLIIINIYNEHTRSINKVDNMYLIKKSKNFNIYCYTKEKQKYLNKEFLNELSKSLENTYKEFTNLFDSKFDSKFDEKIDVKIYETSKDLGESLGISNCNALGYGGVGDIRVVLDIESIVNNKFISIFTHELIHVITLNKNVNLESNYALLEGIATYYGNGITNTEKYNIKSITNNDELPDIKKILYSKSDEIFNMFGYSLYATVIEYINNIYGKEMIVKINNEIGNKTIFEILDYTNEEFDENFMQYIKSEF